MLCINPFEKLRKTFKQTAITYCKLTSSQNILKNVKSVSWMKVRNINDEADDLKQSDPKLRKLLRDMYKDFGMNEEKTLKQLNVKPSGRNLYLKDIQDPEVKKLINEMYNDFGMTAEDTIKELHESNDTTVIDNITEENAAFSGEFNPNIIYDFDEEQLLRKKGLWQEIKKGQKEKEVELDYKRGKTGAFDVEELVNFLREQKAKDIVAIEISPEHKFVDYLVIATGKSIRHVNVLAAFIKKVNKKKKDPTDPFLLEEGKDSNWVAFDMKNIALHIMTEEVRQEKDLEMLWTVGSQYDPLSQDWLRPTVEDDFLNMAD